MKTISLTESAYQRLLSWKNGETFSEVVERMIPSKGTLGAALDAAKALPAFTEDEFEQLEQAINASRAKLPSTWS